MLRFGTAGLPLRLKKGDYRHAMPMLRNELGLDAIEVEFVHGARMKPEIAVEVGELARKNDIAITIHGPYYINLNAVEPEKRESSRNHIISSARLGKLMGARSVTFHAAFYLKQDPEEVFQVVRSELTEIVRVLRDEDNFVSIRPELTGKPSQWGDIFEIVRVSSEVEGVLPCVDFAHNHARYGGKRNSYADFAALLEEVRGKLGPEVLKNMHMHVSGIEYTPMGERKHLVFAEADFRYKDLLRALIDYGVEGVLICESPSIEDDTMFLKREYDELLVTLQGK
ncbi:MAG: deoxyribonuclease IV [Planctomycetota bacterium]